jgi:RNA polymerase sigma-70 factor (ECF subfamily)
VNGVATLLDPAFRARLRALTHDEEGGARVTAGAGERADLVRRAQRGDAQAFAELARAMGRAVYAITLAHLRRPSDAEDVAQDVLLAALENIASCKDPERFDAWLLTIARNRARRALVRRRLRDVFAGTPPEVATSDDDPDRAKRQALLRAMEALPARMREVVLLHDLEGHDHAELAQALGITEEVSRQTLSRARKQVREALAASSEEKQR